MKEIDKWTQLNYKLKVDREYIVRSPLFKTPMKVRILEIAKNYILLKGISGGWNEERWISKQAFNDVWKVEEEIVPKKVNNNKRILKTDLN